MGRHHRRHIVRTAALGLGLAALAVLAVIPSAAARTPQPTADPALANVDTLTPAKGVDLSSVPKIKSYLRSLGIDSSRAVIQRGVRNYAGPNCPGFAWNCTAARGVVVQMAQAGQNKFECTPSLSPVSPGPLSCTVLQDIEDGNNHATCRESSGANPAYPDPELVLSCVVTQINVNGDNHATIDQNVDQRSGAAQNATVNAELFQSNDSGDNHANLSQSISQSTSAVLLGMQSQDADFFADVDQDTDSGGNNHLQQSQTLHQSGRASGTGSILQMQTADHDGQVDQDALEDSEALFSLAGIGLLQAGSDGFSKAHATQFERQFLKGPDDQFQSGPMNCCGAGSQYGSPGQTQFNIHQDSAQSASQASAEQLSHLDGSCFSDGMCSIDHKAKNDEDQITVHASEDGEPIFVHTRCESTEFESEGSGECTSDTTDTDPHYYEG